MSFQRILKSIRHRTECSFFYENVELPTNCISDRWRAYRSSRNLGQTANRPHGPETMGAPAPFRQVCFGRLR